MKYLFLAITLLHVNIFAKDLSFEELRKSEKSLVLKEFKKLFKHRKNIHYNIRQTLKHARSKNLRKNNISFFQAKNSNFQQNHQMEFSNVFFATEVTCENNCKDYTQEANTEIPTIDDSDSIQVTSPTDSDSDIELDFDNDNGSVVEETNSKVRNSINSPWAKK